MKTNLIETIKTEAGEINVYRDRDGYHAERWNERKQCIDRQSGDRKSKAEAVEAVE